MQDWMHDVKEELAGDSFSNRGDGMAERSRYCDPQIWSKSEDCLPYVVSPPKALRRRGYLSWAKDIQIIQQ